MTKRKEVKSWEKEKNMTVAEIEGEKRSRGIKNELKKSLN